ncbi:hypothetical protein [Gordonia crocea]|uniref:Uncharacterized protein n=1 Tax=Gordonia crocea TaxID=589162 RepID=A0A7I9UXS1_9ACTN|nr:hypothetical protein [Gordonia crocea]GED97743.1 hypothetical protein nbrc107697_17820 [Gordonia crocea]
MTNPGPTPGAPKPGQHLAAAGDAATVSPAQVADAISEMLDKLDQVNVAIADAEDGSAVSTAGLAALDRQADLLERAHRVLADALAAIDHA